MEPKQLDAWQALDADTARDLLDVVTRITRNDHPDVAARAFDTAAALLTWDDAGMPRLAAAAAVARRRAAAYVGRRADTAASLDALIDGDPDALADVEHALRGRMPAADPDPAARWSWHRRDLLTRAADSLDARAVARAASWAAADDENRRGKRANLTTDATPWADALAAAVASTGDPDPLGNAHPHGQRPGTTRLEDRRRYPRNVEGIAADLPGMPAATRERRIVRHDWTRADWTRVASAWARVERMERTEATWGALACPVVTRTPLHPVEVARAAADAMERHARTACRIESVEVEHLPATPARSYAARTYALNPVESWQSAHPNCRAAHEHWAADALHRADCEGCPTCHADPCGRPVEWTDDTADDVTATRMTGLAAVHAATDPARALSTRLPGGKVAPSPRSRPGDLGTPTMTVRTPRA